MYNNQIGTTADEPAVDITYCCPKYHMMIRDTAAVHPPHRTKQKIESRVVGGGSVQSTLVGKKKKMMIFLKRQQRPYARYRLTYTVSSQQQHRNAAGRQTMIGY